MEAGVASLGEAVLFTKKIFGAAAMAVTKAAGKGLKTSAGAAWKGAKAAPGAVKTAINTKMGYTTARDYFKNRQYTKELYDSVHVGGSAKDLGVKMTRSTRENIRDAASNGNILVQDKEGGVSAFYDKNYNLRAIRKQDGSFVNANSLSAEDRAKYDLDVDKGFGVINTETGDFVNAMFSRRTGEVTPVGNAYVNDRICKIKDKKTLEKLNKMLQ